VIAASAHDYDKELTHGASASVDEPYTEDRPAHLLHLSRG
jgi:hypothetical protein